MENITEKIRNNAIISYFLIFINITFLLNKDKININNNFVKNHTKTAILIHIGFLINTIVFAYFWLGLNIKFLGYSISDIITIGIYLILFWLMIMWIYKAYSLKTFKIGEKLNYGNNNLNKNNFLEFSSEWTFSEKDKLTIILSRVPFIWFIIYPKYKKNKLIENATKLNLIFSIIFISLYVFWNPNLATLLLLSYIIFTVFSAILLFSQNEIININLNRIPTTSLLLNIIKTNVTYFFNYISNKKDFISFAEILKTKIHIDKKNNDLLKKELDIKDNFKLNNSIIYIPLINFITLFNLNTKQKIHIINWILISIILIIILVLNYIYYIDINYLLFLLFPIFFGLWHLKANIMNYKIPLIFDIFNIFLLIKNKISNIFKKVKKIKNTDKEITLKVWENLENNINLWKKDIKPEIITESKEQNNFDLNQKKSEFKMEDSRVENKEIFKLYEK